MIIKVVHPAERLTGDCEKQLVIGAKSYVIERHRCTDTSLLPEPLRGKPHYIPFGLPNDVSLSGAREKKVSPFDFVILKPSEPYQTPIVVANCLIFVMNDDGKTVDTIGVAA